MTKTTVGLALAGVFGLGYVLGGAGREAISTAAPRARASRHASGTQPNSYTTVATIKSQSGPEQTPNREPAIVTREQEFAAQGNIAFGQLMRSCRQVESDWRERNFKMGAEVKNVWMIQDRAEQDRLRKSTDAMLAQIAQKAEIWRAETSFSVNEKPLTLHSLLRFHTLDEKTEAGPNTCWSLEAWLESEGQRASLPGTGGCGGHEYDSAEETVATVMTYDNKDVADTVSAFIFTLDPTGNSPVRYLAAAGVDAWSELYLDYRPISMDQYQEIEKDLAVRSPASENK